MRWLTKFLSSNIGLKILMALTGAVMIGFVTMHMVGNLQVFLGAEPLDRYGSLLQGLGELLWLARLVLVTVLTVHVTAALVLTFRSLRARPIRYSRRKWFATSLASRTMIYGGVALILFLGVHLAHLTLGWIHPDFTHCHLGELGRLECEVYANVVLGFQVWWMDLFYVVGMVFLGLHLAHGAWSLFRTLGLESARWDAVIHPLAIALGLAIGLGNSLIPLAVLFGVVGL